LAVEILHSENGLDFRTLLKNVPYLKMCMATTDIAKELEALEKHVEELCNTPAMRLIHEMAQEQKKSGKRWLPNFVTDEELR
jgi:hypothetical protein